MVFQTASSTIFINSNKHKSDIVIDDNLQACSSSGKCCRGVTNIIQTRFYYRSNTAQIKNCQLMVKRIFFATLFKPTSHKLCLSQQIKEGLPSSPVAGWHTVCSSSLPLAKPGTKLLAGASSPCSDLICRDSAKHSATPMAVIPEGKDQWVPQTGETWQSFLLKPEKMPSARL